MSTETERGPLKSCGCYHPFYVCEEHRKRTTYTATTCGWFQFWIREENVNEHRD